MQDNLRARANCAFYADLPMVLADDRLSDRQTQSGPPSLTISGGINAEKAFEDIFDILLRNADPIIFDPYDGIRRLLRYVDVDGSFAVFQRIVDENEQELFHLGQIRFDLYFPAVRMKTDIILMKLLGQRRYLPAAGHQIKFLKDDIFVLLGGGQVQ
ncbi:Protein of unknown function [Pyronema omphalodes CBS 100304]|uniref:Uncharacterized protein n=1 Tax=Pyronema omphalodes (strain CBS 100304) TaxID=1076935 RepID=U4LBP8_PYROM|nr:Protein of unknown function [Pyronema omphalodes CBS 100304]